MNYFAEERGATRGLKMLLKKMAGEPFETDLPMPKFDRVEPGKAIEDLSKAKIAIVTSGGIVPLVIRIISSPPMTKIWMVYNGRHGQNV